VLCNARLPAEEVATSFMPDPPATSAATHPPARVAGLAELSAGAVLGGRYEIIQTLGQGGMGAVYQARDREVDRVVALKVIRPELANQSQILARFKQELILSRQVTHKNVVRIFDLGEADNVKFITMEFVAGRDLHSLLRDSTPLTLEQKVKIVVQVCRALEAAHAEGVVHRDLKPQNIMIENTGRVVVMDFGIAHSMEESGGTSTGMLLGTPAYVSPEQAKGEKIDPRSDVYTLGIVFYELLTGKIPFESDSVVGLLLKRIQERPVPPVERDTEIPQALSDIALKCLAVDREQRYQTAQEVQDDLEGWLRSPTTFRTATAMRAAEHRLGKTEGGRTIVTPGIRMMVRSNAWRWIAVSVAVAALIIAGAFVALRRFSTPAGPHAPVTVIIADISNHTGDPIFDGTLEPMLKIALEGAGFISAYDRTQLRNLGAKLEHPSDKLDEQAATQIAVSQGLGVVVSGSLERDRAGYRLSLRATQAVTGSPLANPHDNASNKDQVLFAVTKAATNIRTALGDATSESDQRFAMETLSASSLAAVHEYAVAMQGLSDGKDADARRSFSKAVDLDPNFGLAYAGMAVASRNLAENEEAEKYVRQAMSHIDRMTERERYRTRGMFYFVTGDREKCVEEYSALIAQYPSDVAAHTNLGVCYQHLRNVRKAIEETRRANEILPKRALYRFNLARDEIYAGDFQAAEREVRTALELNGSAEKGFLTLAYAQLGQNQVTQAADTYRKLDKVSALGAVLAPLGLADIALYEGRFAEAAQILEKGAAADLAAKRLDDAADKFTALGYTQLQKQQKGLALAAAGSALAAGKSVKIRFLAARIYLDADLPAKAKELAAGLASERQSEPRAYATLIEGEMDLKRGDARQAIQAFKDANTLLDTWIGRFDLGRAYLEDKQFAAADSEFDRCIKRRGEAIELFMDDVPTLGYFPPVYYYLGRVREGSKSAGFADSYRTYLSLRGKAAEDPLLAEVRRRAGQ